MTGVDLTQLIVALAPIAERMVVAGIEALTHDDPPKPQTVPARPTRRDALGALLTRARLVVVRLDEKMVSSGDEKRASALRVLKQWSEDNGGVFSTSELALALELAVQDVKRGGGQ